MTAHVIILLHAGIGGHTGQNYFLRELNCFTLFPPYHYGYYFKNQGIVLKDVNQKCIMYTAAVIMYCTPVVYIILVKL